MRTLYLDCGMGAAGDMLAAALLELHPDREEFLRRMNQIDLPGVKITAEKTVKYGIEGTHFSVLIHGREEDAGTGHYGHSRGSGAAPHHEHRSMHMLHHRIEKLALPDQVKEDVLAVYRLLAQAESWVHGVPVDQIHFHEVGELDAVADITAVCLLLHELKIESVVVSPVHVGCGTVRCAHGILPVPAPATARLLQGIPVYSDGTKGELCTPTGAALLQYFADSFGNMPTMRISGIGYGMGKKDFERVNCIRALLGEREEENGMVAELCCNVDDMSGEEIGFCLERLIEEGALDAFTTAIGMKKSRPAVLITVICPVSEKERFARYLFSHTSTLGIREKLCSRYVLQRRVEELDTPLGKIRVKHSTGYGVERKKYEYSDLAAAARERNLSLEEIKKILE